MSRNYKNYNIKYIRIFRQLTKWILIIGVLQSYGDQFEQKLNKYMIAHIIV